MKTLLSGLGTVAAIQLILSAPGYAETLVSADATLGAQVVNGERESYRFGEYADPEDGLYGDVNAFAEREGLFAEFTGKSILRDNESYRLSGGKYTRYRYSFFYNEIPHRLSLNDRTYFEGLGGSTLNFTQTQATAPIYATNFSQWNTFDYFTKGKNFGGEVVLSMGTPFFVSLSADRMTTKGQRPFGTNSGSPGAPMVELPEPVDYQDNRASAEIGYGSKNAFAAVNYAVSGFSAKDQYFDFRNPHVLPASSTALDIGTTAPPSLYQKVSLNAVYSGLPFDSLVTARGGLSTLKNEFTILNQMYRFSAPISLQTIDLSEPVFNGDITYRTASFALASHPLSFMDGKIYFNYLQKNNDSDAIVFTSNGLTDTNPIFSYRKQDAGVDVGFKLPLRTKLLAEYEFLKVFRFGERTDARETIDRIYSAKVRNSYLDWFAFNVKAKHVNRTSLFAPEGVSDVITDSSYIRRFLRRYDATDKKQNSYGMGVDFMPLEHLDLGVEFNYKRNDYVATVIGRQEDSRREASVTASYLIPELAKLDAFYDVEKTIFSSANRNFSPSGSGADIKAAPTAANYNWSGRVHDLTWMYGLGATVPVIEEMLEFGVTWQQVVSNGEFRLAAQPGSGIDLGPTMNYDDYRKSTLDTRATYRVGKNLSATVGFLFERLFYDDGQYDGYRLLPPTAAGSTTSFNVLSGAYADREYLARAIYLQASYRF